MAFCITEGQSTCKLIRMQATRMDGDVNNGGKVNQLNLKGEDIVINPDHAVKLTAGGRTEECLASMESILGLAIVDTRVNVERARQR
ncbi:hypothetical protein ACL7TT_19495 [Microbulbifer sp. 2304DJ12-6]|uniref:hypothetical protein n=1 Tax=Microbulbifer sp. 2304DJ12-6 TaxID=3233340 RepID=UPI0039B0E4B3